MIRWNPEDYARNSDAQLKWARELRANLDLQGTEAVLDVGCGDGKITADFAQSLPQGRIVGPDEYTPWLAAAGLQADSLQLVAKDMTHLRAEGLAGWIRTTWMPFTHCVPTEARDIFIDDFLSRYLELVPMDDRGYTHVAMVRLEVRASKL